jgi:signal transduction histidine kinase
MVRQALLNVIHNAIEHCPEGTRIQVLTSPFGRRQAMLRVTDDGPGIPLDQQTHVFKRFYRGPNTTRRRGLGLGLSIAKAFLKSQRGNIFLRSELGTGCCFTLTLPRLPEPGGSRRPRVVADSDDLSEETEDRQPRDRSGKTAIQEGRGRRW